MSLIRSVASHLAHPLTIQRGSLPPIYITNEYKIPDLYTLPLSVSTVGTTAAFVSKKISSVTYGKFLLLTALHFYAYTAIIKKRVLKKLEPFAQANDQLANLKIHKVVPLPKATHKMHEIVATPLIWIIVSYAGFTEVDEDTRPLKEQNLLHLQTKVNREQIFSFFLQQGAPKTDFAKISTLFEEEKKEILRRMKSFVVSGYTESLPEKVREGLEKVDGGQDLSFEEKKAVLITLLSPRDASTMDMYDKMNAVALYLLDINTRFKDGQTLLHEAAKTKDLAAIKALIAFGINIHARDNSGKTAVAYAPTHWKEQDPANWYAMRDVPNECHSYLIAQGISDT